MRGSAPWRSPRGMALGCSEHPGRAQQIPVCCVAEAGSGGWGWGALTGKRPVGGPLNWVSSKMDSDRPTHFPAFVATLEITLERMDVCRFGPKPMSG